MKTYRVAIAGFAHMHINDVARHFFDCPRTELVACADTVPALPEFVKAPYTRDWNRDFCVENFHIPRVYADYREMLDREMPDFVVIASENDAHREIVEMCAGRGIGAVVEKPMAVSLSDAMAMERAAAAGAAPLMVNWPITWIPAYHKMKGLLDSGAVGRPLEFRIRTSHTGPLGAGAKHKGVSEAAKPMSGPEKGRTWWHQAQRGGGAMLDFCCYGSLLSRWLLGEDALAAFGLRANLDSPYGDADDNAAMLVRYSGAMASIETSWTTPCEPIPSNIPMIYGTGGVMTMVSTPRGEAVKLLRPGELEEIAYPDAPPEGLLDVAWACVRYLDTGNAPHETLGLPLNIAAMSILDAGIRSASSGRMELIQGERWQIG